LFPPHRRICQWGIASFRRGAVGGATAIPEDNYPLLSAAGIHTWRPAIIKSIRQQ
jgi:hypothetical protein